MCNLSLNAFAFLCILTFSQSNGFALLVEEMFENSLLMMPNTGGVMTKTPQSLSVTCFLLAFVQKLNPSPSQSPCPAVWGRRQASMLIQGLKTKKNTILLFM